jgi:energy-coupling factor transporter ATP-binding protein EcfA2
MSKYFYKVYGLCIGSELELPELAMVEDPEMNVTIEFGYVPEHLPVIRGSGVLFEAAPNDFLFKFEGIGRYRVQNGSQITIQPEREALAKEIRLVLLGSCIGALLHQRGMLALHGSAISDGYKTVILTGPSGVGKSTLAAGLNELGYSVIADDISVIGQNGHGHFIVESGIPHLKLWKDVLAHLNKRDDLSKVRPHLEKYRMPIPVVKVHSPVVSTILVLNPSNSTDFSYSRIIGREKFHLLRNNTYRLQFIDRMNQTEVHFRNLSKLVNSIQMYDVNRPRDPLNILEFAKYIAGIVFSS